MTIATQLTESYGIRHPFVVAGMGFAGMRPPLAVAICEAGGIGSVGVAAMPPPALRRLITAVRAQTSAPFDVNLLGVFATPEHIEVCAEERVPIVSFHWGHPERAVIERLHQAGCRVWEQVGSTDNAIRAVADGVDAIVAQGIEARRGPADPSNRLVVRHGVGREAVMRPTRTSLRPASTCSDTPGSL